MSDLHRVAVVVNGNAKSVTVPIAGTWTMKITVRTSEIDQVSVTKSVRIVA